MSAACSWLVEDRRIPPHEDPAIGLKKRKTDADRRRERRAITWDQFSKLIEATQKSPTIRGLTGIDRAVLYTLACYTGYRRGALAGLRVRDFDFTAGAVKLPAAVAKNRRASPPMPLRPEVVEMIQAYVEDRGLELGELLFPRIPDKSAEMVRRDLEAAGIPYQDELGRVLDLHALRVSFNTELGRQGVELSIRQKLLHHSDPRLTSNGYTAPLAEDFREAVNRLPRAPKVAIQESVASNHTVGGISGANDVALPVAPP